MEELFKYDQLYFRRLVCDSFEADQERERFRIITELQDFSEIPMTEEYPGSLVFYIPLGPRWYFWLAKEFKRFSMSLTNYIILRRLCPGTYPWTIPNLNKKGNYLLKYGEPLSIADQMSYLLQDYLQPEIIERPDGKILYRWTALRIDGFPEVEIELEISGNIESQIRIRYLKDKKWYSLGSSQDIVKEFNSFGRIHNESYPYVSLWIIRAFLLYNLIPDYNARLEEMYKNILRIK